MAATRTVVERLVSHVPRRGLIAFGVCFALAVPEAAAGPVVVLKSDDLEAYETVSASFVEAMGKDVGVWSLEGNRDRANEVAARLKRNPPDLIFALGSKAAYTAVREFPDTPIVYGLLRDPRRYGVKGSNVTGIGMDLPAETVLSQFRLFAPEVKTIGIVIGEKSVMGDELVQAARATGFELQIRRVQGTKYVRPVFARLSRRVDAVWVINDPDVLDPENFRFMREQVRQEGIPMMVTSEALVLAGALLAVIPDYKTTGSQAADLARAILETGTNAGQFPPVPPEGMRVVLNRDTAEAIDWEIDPMLLDFTDQVVGEIQAR